MTPKGIFQLRTAKDLLAKLERDLIRVSRDLLDGDSAFDFFVTAHHLLDWVYPGYGNRGERQKIRNRSELLQIAADLADGSKHFEAEASHHKSVADTGLRTGAFGQRAFDKSAFDVGELVVYLDGEAARVFGSPVRVIELAEQLVEYWRHQLA